MSADPEKQAEFFAAEMEKMQQDDAQFAALNAENGDKMKAVYDSMFSKLLNPKGKPQPLPEAVQEIVNVLLAQPRLVPYVANNLKAKVAQLNAAIDSVLNQE